MRHKDKIIATVTAVVAVAVIICAIVIACMRLGIVEGYDFGAGAYYYADIQDWKQAKFWLKRAKKNGYKDKELQKRINRHL